MGLRDRVLVLVAILCGCADDSAATRPGGSSDASTGTEVGGTETGAETGTGAEAPELPDPWLHSDRERIRDGLDRVVVLRGANARVEGVFDVSFDDGRRPLEEVPSFTVEDADRMRRLGFNVLRLPINWSGIEPEPGAYDEAYLDRVDALVQLCAEAGIWVILDFHQDAYSKEIGEDGAPLWAIEPPPTELLGGPLGDSLEERRFSPQVMAAFATFFDDTDDDPTDQWLQEAFAAMARHVAERFADEPWVLGYELYNEPVAADPLVWTFHERVVAAIREVDERHLLLFEPNVARNVLEHAPLSSTPFVDAQGVYAPHLYTYSFGDSSAELAELSEHDLRPNVEAATAEAASWRAPLFVGEWGISPDAPNADLYVALMYDLFDAGLHHSTVWLWKEHSQGRWGLFEHDDATGSWSERAELVAAHARPFAPAVAGEPVSVHYDRDARVLEVRLMGRDDGVMSRLHVPEPRWYPDAFEVRCDGAVVAGPDDRDPDSGELDVPCGGAGEHVIELRPA